MTGSNRRHPACKAGALPTELITLCEVLHLAVLLNSAKKRIKTQLAVSGKRLAVKIYRPHVCLRIHFALVPVFIEELKICIYFLGEPVFFR